MNIINICSLIYITYIRDVYMEKTIMMAKHTLWYIHRYCHVYVICFYRAVLHPYAYKNM